MLNLLELLAFLVFLCLGKWFQTLRHSWDQILTFLLRSLQYSKIRMEVQIQKRSFTLGTINDITGKYPIEKRRRVYPSKTLWFFWTDIIVREILPSCKDPAKYFSLALLAQKARLGLARPPYLCGGLLLLCSILLNLGKTEVLPVLPPTSPLFFMTSSKVPKYENTLSKF